MTNKTYFKLHSSEYNQHVKHRISIEAFYSEYTYVHIARRYGEISHFPILIPSNQKSLVGQK